jgi:hypothetical protein
LSDEPVEQQSSQNHQLKLSEERSRLDLQINILAERKIAKLIALLEELRRDLPYVRNRDDAEAVAMETHADPQIVADALEEAMRPYLEVTFRKGKPLAASLHLPRASGAKAARSDARPQGLVVDFTADGEPFGVEITAPGLVDLDALPVEGGNARVGWRTVDRSDSIGRLTRSDFGP